MGTACRTRGRASTASRPTSRRRSDGPSGDPDADGISNLDEYPSRFHPRGAVHRYLAEGLTGADVNTRLTVTNADAVEATVLLSFFSEKGRLTSVPSRWLPASVRWSILARFRPWPTRRSRRRSNQIKRRLSDASTGPQPGRRRRLRPSRLPPLAGISPWARPAIRWSCSIWCRTRATRPRTCRSDSAAGRARTDYELHRVAPGSRLTIWVDNELGALSGADVAAEVVSLKTPPSSWSGRCTWEFGQWRRPLQRMAPA